MASLLQRCGGPKLLIRGQHVELRPLTKLDCSGSYVAWLNDAEINRYSARRTSISTKDDVLTYVESCNASETAMLLGIFLHDGGQHIGNILLSDYVASDHRAEISNLVGATKCWGKGAGVEANVLLLHFGFTMLDIHKFCMGNLRAHRAATFFSTQLGYVREGILRQQVQIGGLFEDVIRFGLLKTDFYKRFPHLLGRPAIPHTSA